MTFTPKSKTSINERQAGILVQVCLSPNPTPLSHTVYGVKDSPRRLAWQVACESHTIVVRRDGCIVLMDMAMSRCSGLVCGWSLPRTVSFWAVCFYF